MNSFASPNGWWVITCVIPKKNGSPKRNGTLRGFGATLRLPQDEDLKPRGKAGSGAHGLTLRNEIFLVFEDHE